MDNRLPPIPSSQHLNTSLPLLLPAQHPPSLPPVSSLSDASISQSPPSTPTLSLSSALPQPTWPTTFSSSPTLSLPLPQHTIQLVPTQNVSEQERVLSTIKVSNQLTNKIHSLEEAFNQHHRIQYLNEIKQDMRKRCKPFLIGVDSKCRLIFPNQQVHNDWLSKYDYPPIDDEPEEYLEEVPGFEVENLKRLKSIFRTALTKTRLATEEAIAETEGMYARQLGFRIVTVEEVEYRMCYTVNRFKKVRSMVLARFKQYIRNRKWIENVATRQRRGCLSHKQNNILRLWLFTNFSDPYPSAHDKKRLMLRANLDKTQINNWLINARSRVWKPTIETMLESKIKEMLKKKDTYLYNDDSLLTNHDVDIERDEIHVDDEDETANCSKEQNNHVVRQPHLSTSWNSNQNNNSNRAGSSSSHGL